MRRYGLLEDEALFSVDFMIIKIAPTCKKLNAFLQVCAI